MSSLADRKTRFSDAAKAIETTPKALRNWIARRQVVLYGQEDTRVWHDFSLADVASLAITRRLVDFGLKVEEANVLARRILSTLQGPQFAHAEDFEKLMGFWEERRVAVCHELEGWRLIRVMDGDRIDPDACILLNVHGILARVSARLAENEA
ncbi:hypothetical protein [Edaphosphingomonas haloaromaticamans]|uniref:HTH merR-type domain-containing protein n=1 Tax=Edaphosphingomonas haloaromaticamans TaxID=653954 RepID=A0A1S1HP75_9SPHN|nr:hypothetical protein [Sphingomonas haloaromaticamans]OHT22180.1 hypothetical protein BHE75_04204 [Sphingomonas haloaromaticamans]